MPSKTDIANFALGLIAEETITSLTDNSETARKCLLHLAPTVREVLELAPWRSCRKRKSLVEISTPPEFGWARQFALPNDFAAIAMFNNIEVDYRLRPLFEIEGRVLMTNEDTAKIVYVQDVTKTDSDADYGLLGALQVRVIYTLLASKLAWHIQQNRTQQESLYQQFEMELRRAKGRNARQAWSERVDSGYESDWLKARYIGTGA